MREPPNQTPTAADSAGSAGFEAVDVSHRYGETVALAEIELSVAPGECVALVGESGSGKTTLLRCFNRMVTPERGTIRVDGRDVREMDEFDLRRRIGYVQQEGGLLPHWTVQRNVEMVPWLRGEDGVAGKASAALASVGLEPATFAGRWPIELSGGQRQRVALARALAASPELLLLDEPFGALDAITRSELLDLFADVRRRLGTTTLLVTHDLNVAVRLADRVAVMRDGRIEQTAPIGSLVQSPATPYVRRLVERAGLRV